jgi:predicted DNA-binding transcriptional regulator AlpA
MSSKKVVNFKRLKSDYGVPYSRSHIMRLMPAARFPRAFKLGDDRNSPLVWWEEDIINWLEARAALSATAP